MPRAKILQVISSCSCNKRRKAGCKLLSERHWHLDLQVTLVYHAKLDDTWLEAAKQLQSKLQKLRPGVAIGIIGRSKNQKLVLDRDFLIERMPVGNKSFQYKQVSRTACLPHLCLCRSPAYDSMTASLPLGAFDFLRQGMQCRCEMKRACLGR